MLPAATQPCRRASRLLLRLLARSQPAPPSDARLPCSTLAANFDTLHSFEEVDEGGEEGTGDSLVPWVDEAAANEPSLQARGPPRRLHPSARAHAHAPLSRSCRSACEWL